MGYGELVIVLWVGRRVMKMGCCCSVGRMVWDKVVDGYWFMSSAYISGAPRESLMTLTMCAHSGSILENIKRFRASILDTHCQSLASSVAIFEVFVVI